MDSKKYKGRLSISKNDSGDRSFVRIELMDESSGTVVTRIEMGMEGFANALMGLSYVPCEFDLHHKNVGKIHEHKEKVVEVPELKHGDKAGAQKALKPYEKDGWKGEWTDVLNTTHRRVGPAGKRGKKDKMRVRFFRFVDPPEEKK